MKIKSTKSNLLSASEFLSDAAAFALVLIIFVYVSIFSGNSKAETANQNSYYHTEITSRDQSISQKESWYSNVQNTLDNVIPKKSQVSSNSDQISKKHHTNAAEKESLVDPRVSNDAEKDYKFDSFWNNLLAAEPYFEKVNQPGKQQSVLNADVQESKNYNEESRFTLDQFKRMLKLINVRPTGENLAKAPKNSASSNALHNHLQDDWSFLADHKGKPDSWSTVEDDFFRENRPKASTKAKLKIVMILSATADHLRGNCKASRINCDERVLSRVGARKNRRNINNTFSDHELVMKWSREDAFIDSGISRNRKEENPFQDSIFLKYDAESPLRDSPGASYEQTANFKAGSQHLFRKDRLLLKKYRFDADIVNSYENCILQYLIDSFVCKEYEFVKASESLVDEEDWVSVENNDFNRGFNKESALIGKLVLEIPNSILRSVVHCLCRFYGLKSFTEGGAVKGTVISIPERFLNNFDLYNFPEKSFSELYAVIK